MGWVNRVITAINDATDDFDSGTLVKRDADGNFKSSSEPTDGYHVINKAYFDANNVGGGVTGSGLTGQIAYWGPGAAPQPLTGQNDLAWDYASQILYVRDSGDEQTLISPNYHIWYKNSTPTAAAAVGMFVPGGAGGTDDLVLSTYTAATGWVGVVCVTGATKRVGIGLGGALPTEALEVGGNVKATAFLYTVGDATKWAGAPPTTLAQACDRLAAQLTALGLVPVP